MEYWLSNGHAPKGMVSGLHLLTIDNATLRVEQIKGQWSVRDAGRVLFNFRTNEADARNALSILHKYGFTQVGTIGGAGPAMIVMLGHFDGASDTDKSMPHLVHQSPLHSGPANATTASKLSFARQDIKSSNFPTLESTDKGGRGTVMIR